MARRKLASRKSSKVKTVPTELRPASVIAYLGRVNADLAVFIWGFSEAEARVAADSISKQVEMQYQIDLLQRSGIVEKVP